LLKLSSVQRWALLPVAAIGGCTGTSALAGKADNVLILFMTPASLEAALPLDVRYGLVNAASAIVFVVLGAWVAPRHRTVVAFTLFAFGAFIARLELRHWWFPEGHPRAYQTSEVPLALTLIGGVIGIIASVVAFGRRRDRPREEVREGSV
jgi:hypothetical protein